VFIASPIALEWTRAVEKRRKRRDVQRFGRPAGADATLRGGADATPRGGAGIRQPEGAAAPASSRAAGGRQIEEVPAAGEPSSGRTTPEGVEEVRERPQAPPRRGGPVQVTRTQPSRKKKKKKH
jgi:hypothetical protein